MNLAVFLRPRFNEIERVFTDFIMSVCLSVCLSVRLSVRLSVCGQNRVYSGPPTILVRTLWHQENPFLIANGTQCALVWRRSCCIVMPWWEKNVTILCLRNSNYSRLLICESPVCCLNNLSWPMLSNESDMDMRDKCYCVVPWNKHIKWRY